MFKIQHTNVPLSYYTGIFGKPIFFPFWYILERWMYNSRKLIITVMVICEPKEQMGFSWLFLLTLVKMILIISKQMLHVTIDAHFFPGWSTYMWYSCKI